MTIFRSLAGALAALALAAPAASAHDAEIFATNNTAVITDRIRRLDDRLKDFERQVERIIADGGGKARGSQLLDGVFFSAEQNTTTFERSRGFDVDHVSDDELHTIADTIRSRFGQESVLTFDRLSAGDPDVDAIELEVPGVSAKALRKGLLADPGGARAAVRRLGDPGRASAARRRPRRRAARPRVREAHRRRPAPAVTRYGKREFVEGPLPVRVERARSSSSADDRRAGSAPGGSRSISR